uniref:Polygalacturonase n=1 Tax=Hordeum vulgare subsp. vulgare TaxID=112509 RepID=A0A8I6XKU2_HORVV
MATATALLRLAALAGAVALLLPGAAEARVLLSLDDFGAVRDGIADDTQALVDAWKVACAYSNGYVVIHVPAGKSYQIWPVTLAGPCRDEIMLFVSGNIIVTESPEDWDRSDGGKWLHFFQVQDLTVSGGDVIDGRGQEWWARRPARGRSTTTTSTSSTVSMTRPPADFMGGRPISSSP